MGHLLGNLTNTQVSDPTTGQVSYGSPQQAAQTIGQMQKAPTFSQDMGNGVDQAQPSQFKTDTAAVDPRVSKPSFVQAAQQNLSRPGGALADPNMTKGGKLLQILSSAVQGGAAGWAAGSHGNPREGYGGAAAGFQAGQQLPFVQAMSRRNEAIGNLDLQQKQLQNQYFPQILGQGIAKTNSEIYKNSAEGQKAQAGAGGQIYENALHEAQAAAAKYKEVGGVLYDVSGAQPVPVQGAAGQFVPADEQMAAIGGIPVGTKLPIETATKLKSMANEGIHPMQANGRSLLVDSTGKTIADVGKSTPLVVMDQQRSPVPLTPEMQQKIDAVGSGKMDLQTALRTYIRYPGMADTFTSELFKQHPDYNQATYGVSKKAMEYFTTGPGGNELTAFRTAIAHADLLAKAAEQLGNGTWRPGNEIENSLKKQFGDPSITNFDNIAKVYTGEVTKAINAGHVTNGELEAVGALIPNNASMQQIAGAMEAFKQLMASKAQQRMIQWDAAQQGKPAFPEGMGGNGAPPAGAKVRDFSQVGK